MVTLLGGVSAPRIVINVIIVSSRRLFSRCHGGNSTTVIVSRAGGLSGLFGNLFGGCSGWLP